MESDEHSVVCKIQKFNSWVLGGAVAAERETSMREDTSLESTSTDCPYTRRDVPQSHLLFPACQEAGDPLTDGGGVQ